MLAITPRALGLDVPNLASYYRAVADWILPHLHDRPLALLRSLDEQDLPFLQKHAKKDTPRALVRVPISEPAGTVEHLAVCDSAGLLSLAEIEVLEIHVWGSNRHQLDLPDRLIFDLDPGPDVSFKEVVEGAVLLEHSLRDRGLSSFALLTGSRGVHLVCPLIPHADWTRAQSFAKEIVAHLAERYPSRFVTTPAMTERAGRIFIDPLRNSWGATSIAPYSPRARLGAPVAAPVSWTELAGAASPAAHDMESMRARLARIEQDPWEGFWKIRQSL